MRLTHVRIENFRSIENTDRFAIGDLTCLVGKNEAGKTAILQALQGQAPLVKPQTLYDVTKEYPRRHVTKYAQRHPDGHGEVVRTWWEIEDDDLALVAKEFGASVLKSRAIEVARFYKKPGLTWGLQVDEAAAIAFMFDLEGLSDAEREPLAGCPGSAELISRLNGLPERTFKHRALLARMRTFREQSILYRVMDLLAPRMPKFFYASHYDRMSGSVSVAALAADKKNNRISIGDQIFLDFLDMAGTSIEDLAGSANFEDLSARTEAASNEIAEQIFKYWRQNDALEVKVDFSEGKPGDEPPFNTGIVARARVWNTLHRASVPFSERSAGFVWFFSFLVQFTAMRKHAANAIILLDEPGLTLHAKAQADLLEYIRTELLPNHQVIFTTHSPFMIPIESLASVRLVEDVVIRKGASRPEIIGTKVRDEGRVTNPDTLFPVRGALGYDLARTLSVGKYTLLVESPSDILYLQALSEAVKGRGRLGLDPAWTLCPSGRLGRIRPFVDLLGGDTTRVAVLIDVGEDEVHAFEALKRSDTFGKDHMYAVSEFASKPLAGIPDLFAEPLFARLLNAAHGLSGANELSDTALSAADPSAGRLADQAAAAFRALPDGARVFDPFTPASWLIRNPAFLDASDDDVAQTLDRAERCFQAFNDLIQSET